MWENLFMDMMYEEPEMVDPKDDFKRYCVNENADALPGAFAGKITVHAGLMDEFASADNTYEILERVLNEDRDNITVVYIHMPFCETYCIYCGFYNQPYRKESGKIYTDAVIKEILLWEGKRAVRSCPVNAFCFGVGTPKALGPEDMVMLPTTFFLWPTIAR